MDKKLVVGIGVAVLVMVIAGSFYYLMRNVPSPDEVKTIEDVVSEVVSIPVATTSSEQVNPSPTKKVRVLSPNGGGVWQKQKQYVVKWDTSTLSKDIKVTAVLLKTGSVINDPYTAPIKAQSFEMFVSSQFPTGLPKEGSITYTVPETIPSGSYQMLVWAGENCALTKKTQRCDFDLSDGLFTIK